MTTPDPAAASVLPPAATPPAATETTPPWGKDEDFDPQKAWNLIQGLRADKETLSKRPVLDDESKAKLAEYDKNKAANQSELEKANESLARYQTESEKWRTAAVSAKVEALAATDFADPSDAVNGLDPAKYLDAGGTINEQAIKTDLAALLEAKPHYKRAEGTAPTIRVPKPSTAQGSSASGAATSDLGVQFGASLAQALNR